MTACKQPPCQSQESRASVRVWECGSEGGDVLRRAYGYAYAQPVYEPLPLPMGMGMGCSDEPPSESLTSLPPSLCLMANERMRMAHGAARTPYPYSSSYCY